MSEREDQLLDDRHNQLMEAIKGVHVRLDVLNGRTRKLEVDVSTLKWRLGALWGGLAAFVAWVFKG